MQEPVDKQAIAATGGIVFPDECADSESNREPTDSYHFGLRRRSITWSVRGLDFAFAFASTRSGGCRQVSTPSLAGLARRWDREDRSPILTPFTRVISGAVLIVQQESVALPIELSALVMRPTCPVDPPSGDNLSINIERSMTGTH